MLHGLEKKLDPGKPATTDVSGKIDRNTPFRWHEAIDKLRKAKILPAYIDAGYLALYADASYFLIYQRVAGAVAAVARTIGVEVETARLIGIGVDPALAPAATDPLRLTAVPVFNPEGGYATYVLPAAFVLLVLIVLLWKLYLATPLGLSLYAAGENPVGAYRSGVPVDGARIAAYAISGLLSTGAGLFVAAQTGSGDPVIGAAFTLNSIAAAVLGGIGFLGGQGTMRGALAGSLLMSILISVMFFLRLPLVAQYVVQGLIIVVTVALPLVRNAWRRAS